MGYPCVTVNMSALRENIRMTADLCHRRGMSFAAVVKGVCADEQIVSLLEESGCDLLADARLQNLRTLKTKKPRLLIREAQRWELSEMPLYADISFQSEPETIRELGAVCARLGVRHKVLLTCDLGDLREGCFFRDEESIFAAADAVVKEPYLELYGVAMNLGCFGGVMPCEENMTGLVAIADRLRSKYGLPLPMVSGASTIFVRELQDGTVAPGINACRIGELWLCGTDPSRGCFAPPFRSDCFTLEAQLVEIKEKPSKPIGPVGGDAFGHVTEHPDLGTMRRGIVACGKQDMDLESLRPVDERVAVLGGSSDYILLDLTRAPGYRVGDTVKFHLGYAGVMRAFTSAYVERRYTEGEA